MNFKEKSYPQEDFFSMSKFQIFNCDIKSYAESYMLSGPIQMPEVPPQSEKFILQTLDVTLTMPQ